ncbi:MAG: YicC/YloC family endoribonuclease [Acidobacteriota bacterium]
MRSMTGFGRATQETPKVSVTCEVKQVNHRFLDIWLKLPESYASVEDRFRAEVSEMVRRGRIEVRLTRTLTSSASVDASLFDDVSIGRAIAALTHLKDKHGVPGVIDLRTLLLFPAIQETFSDMGAPDDAEVEIGIGALRAALTAADAMRLREGEKLKGAIAREIALFCEGARRIADRAAAHRATLAARMRERLAEIAKDVTIDERRIMEEAAVYAERLDITEEIARLDSHIHQMEGFLALAEPVGKRMDFLLQELLREVNTIASKSRDASISHEVVQLKAGLEKAREQVQNVE